MFSRLVSFIGVAQSHIGGLEALGSMREEVCHPTILTHLLLPNEREHEEQTNPLAETSPPEGRLAALDDEPSGELWGARPALGWVSNSR